MEHVFDTHCHLNRPEFTADREQVIARARSLQVQMLTVGTCLETSRQSVRIAAAHEGVYAAVGIHPNDTDAARQEDLDALRALIASAPPGKVVALGEIGLDYYRDRAPRETQIRWLEAQLALARELSLPVLLHARESGEDLLDRIEPFLSGGGRAVWHCFVAGKKHLRTFLDRAVRLGLYLGLGGLVTFEDQKPLRELVPAIPDRHILLDTDSPFLIPRPRTVERNEPAQCIRICEEIAALRGVSVSDIARITTRNACAFLDLPLPGGGPAESAIAYVIRNSLYLGLTNECTNDCSFCARNHSYVVKGHDIRLARDPSAAEVMRAMGDAARYEEVVFCGFGEPTMRLEVLKEVARELKRRGQIVRLNTNGLGSLYHERDIVPELVGLVDVVSVSLNTADPCQYHRLCRSQFGHAAYGAVCEFVRACAQAGLKTICTIVDMPEIDQEAARTRAAELGAELRVRSYVDVG